MAPADLHDGPAALRRHLLQQADEVAAGLAGRAQEIEALRHLPPDIADDLAARGLMRLLTPASVGGHEVPVATFFELIERLARADASVAWCSFIACTASVPAAWLPEAEARQLFGSPTLKAAGVFAPRGRALPATVDGVAGWRVSGRWFWGSGAQHADVISGGCTVPGADGRPEPMADGTPRVLSVLFDRAQVRLIDNWTSVGLCGTGSGEFAVDDVFVPAGRVTSLLGLPRETGPLYRFPVFGLLALAIAAVACGIGRQAIDALVSLASDKVPQGGSKALAQRPATQEAVARAEARLRSARAFVMASIDAAWQSAQSAALAGPPGPDGIPLAQRADLRLAATHAVHTAAEVVDRMFTLAGGHAVFADSPLQRCLRDVHVATQHMMVAEPTYELVGRLQLGLPTSTSML
ncbi:acyl-CoA dehydrogenase family protein [Ideonella sp. A 288]|uniref:acyl-CoA dehydrogenase family protein n=1 Tax=Ideonella sp. A 288 TaxID=1962181 RepID=UPI000B4BB427|nr:acyl-CoA dehydrogenase family protein [Ideonella sp. A 288]